MKLKLAALLIALPLGVSMIAKSASAAEVNRDFNDRSHSAPSAIVVADDHTSDRYQPQREVVRRPELRRVWVAGHSQQTAHNHRQWIPGHWETRR